jgi:hypothetical protein
MHRALLPVFTYITTVSCLDTVVSLLLLLIPESSNHRRHHHSSFWEIAFLRRFCQIESIFHLFEFRDSIYFSYGTRWSASHSAPIPQNSS